MKALPLAAVAAALLLTSVVSAQDRGRGEHIGRVVADCDRRADEFQQSFRRALEYREYRGHIRQEELDRHAEALSRSMGRVREAWNREHDAGRTRHFVEDAIKASREINHVMANEHFRPELHRQWEGVRLELNHLAEAFDLPPLRWE
jgi:hypothetical protein